MAAEADVTAQPQRDGPFQTERVVTISGAHAVHDTYTSFLPPLLPVFIETLSLTITQAGFLTVFMQAPSLFQPMIGHLADRLSLRYFVILAPGVTATAMSLLGIAPSYAALAVLLVIAGLTSASLHSVAPVMSGRLSGKNLGRGMGFWMVGGEVGRTLGPLVIVAAIQYFGLASTPWLMVGGWLATVILYVRLRDVPGRPAHAVDGLPWREALRAMGPFLVPLVGIVTVRSFMITALTTYLPVLLTEQGASLWFAGISLSILEVAGVAGALLGGSLSDRLGRRWILLVSLAATPVVMLVFLAASGWMQFPLLLCLGFTALSMTPVIMALVQESFPRNPALANGVYMSLSFVIRSGAIIVVGLMADLWDMRIAFAVSAVIPLLGLPFLLLLPPRRR